MSRALLRGPRNKYVNSLGRLAFKDRMVAVAHSSFQLCLITSFVFDSYVYNRAAGSDFAARSMDSIRLRDDQIA